MKFTAINFTCPSCGAPQRFSPLQKTLTCEFCHTQTSIAHTYEEIQEYDFHQAISTLQSNKTQTIDKRIHCQKCGGDFTLTPYSFSSHCPYCNTPAIIDFIQDITPQSLLPFTISHTEAQNYFKKWVGSRWFAPNAFKKYLHSENTLMGYYLPYWTYDSDSTSSYQGLRGDTYYVTVTKTIIENGRERQIQTQEPRINWTPVSGVVHVTFDDITIGASKTISRAILDALEPWDTTQLLSYNDKYLVGFEAEEYTVGLDNGFEFAKAKMAKTIKQAIRQDIGGDTQQIQAIDIKHDNITYKNVLFPVWTASFKWKDKTYHYAINAQSAKVVGDRPYSYIKITWIVFLCLALLSGLMYLDKEGILDAYLNTSSIPSYEN